MYYFPILSINAIVEAMGALQISLSAAELKAPTEKLVESILEHFLEPLLGITKEDLRQPSLQGLEYFKNYPELHEEAFNKLMRMRSYLSMMKTVAMNDCSLHDLTNPTPQRVRIMLSALINFLMYREQKVEMYQELTNQQEKLLKTRATLEEENNQFQAQLDKLLADRAQEEPIVKELEGEIASLSAGLTAAWNNQSAIKNDITQLKTEVQEYKDKAMQDAATLTTLKADCDKLRNQLIKSPKKVKAMLKDMSETVTSEREEIKELKAKLRNVQTRAQGLARVTAEVNERLCTLQELTDYVDRTDKVRAETKDHANSAKNLDREIRDVAEQQQHLRQKMAALQDKTFALQNTFEQQKHMAKVALERVANERTQVLRNNKDREIIERNQSIVREKQNLLERKEEAHNATLAAVRAKLDEVAQSLHSYHSKLEQAISTTNAV